MNLSNLVTPAQPVVTPDAVKAMTDAFRQGQITAGDILDRVGELGKAKRKAELHIAQSVGSPEADAARKAALAQSTAQAGLGTAQATAGTGLVGPQTQLAKSQIDLQQAQTKYGTGIQAFQQLAPFSSDFTGEYPTKPDGSLDYDTMGIEGNHLQALMNQRMYAAERLKPVGPPQKEIRNGREFLVTRNQLGEDISPSPENPTYQQYRQMASQQFGFKFWKPGQAVTSSLTPPTPAAPAPPATRPITDQERAAMVEARSIPSPVANKLRPEDVQAALQTTEVPTVSPLSTAAPEGKAMLEPGTTYAAGTGITSGAIEPSFPAGITEQARKQKSYENWNQSKSYYNTMVNTMGQIDKIPIEDQRKGKVNLNAQDIELVSNFVKLYDPGAVIREFKFDKIEHSQPIPDQVKNWMSTITLNGQLTPETRKELFRTATEAMRGKEQAILPDLKMAQERASAANIPITQVLNPEEQKLVSGQFTPSYGGGGTGTQAADTKTLPGGVVMQKGPDGVWRIRQ